MKNAIGGIPALALVMFFIVVISGYIAFTINYSKAFKVNSKIIDILETTAQNTAINNRRTNKSELLFNPQYALAVQAEVEDYLDEVGYSVNSDWISNYCPGSAFTSNYGQVGRQGWCVKMVDSGDDEGTVYFQVKTFIAIDIPVLNKVLMGNNFFQITGTTKSLFTHVK